MNHLEDPREFSSTDDAPTNTGKLGNDKDWDEVRHSPANMNHGEDPTEDCWDEPGYDDWEGDYGERFD